MTELPELASQEGEPGLIRAFLDKETLARLEVRQDGVDGLVEAGLGVDGVEAEKLLIQWLVGDGGGRSGRGWIKRGLGLMVGEHGLVFYLPLLRAARSLFDGEENDSSLLLRSF